MIELAPWDPNAAWSVFHRLDNADWAEAQAMRGGTGSGVLDLFADWRAMQAHACLSLVLKSHGSPFAVLAVGDTGQSGVAQAALLARNHTRFRLQLAQAGALIRRRLPGFCAELGIHRIEARAWFDHPRAHAFLDLCGFDLEATMHGFGADGREIFCQYAWTAPHLRPVLTPDDPSAPTP